jgi:hypothetical protein
VCGGDISDYRDRLAEQFDDPVQPPLLQNNDPEQTQRAKALGLLFQNVAAFAFGVRKMPC